MAPARLRLVALCAAFAVVLALRVIAHADLGRDLAISMPILDGRWSLDQASRIADGEIWGKSPFFMAPLYPHLLVPFSTFFADPVAPIRALQIVVGLLTWLMAVLFAWKRIGPGAAVAAGWLLALAGPPILYENLLLVDPWISLILITLLWFDPSRGGRGRAVLAGALAALAALGRPSYLVLAPVVWLRILLSRPEVTKRGAPSPSKMKLLFASLAGWAVILAPIALQNAGSGAPGTLVSTNGGINLYLGFHDESRGGFSMPPELLVQEDPTGQRAAAFMTGRSVTPAEASRFWMRRAVDWIFENPGRALLLELRKLGLWLGAREQPQIEVFPVLRSRHTVLRWAPLHFGWFVALGLLGLFTEWRRREFWRRWGFWVGILSVCLLTSLATFAVGRFRLPAWGLLSLPAGAGIAFMVESARRGLAKRLLYALVAVGLVLLLTAIMPSANLTRAAAHFHHSLAQRHLTIGEAEAALDEVDKARSLDPDVPFLDHTRGAALASLGRRDEAIKAYLRSISRGPHPKTYQNLGTLYGQMGRHEEALRYLEKAAQIRPDDPALLTDYGVALWENRRFEEAREVWLRALKRNPYDERLRTYLEMPITSE